MLCWCVEGLQCGEGGMEGEGPFESPGLLMVLVEVPMLLSISLCATGASAVCMPGACTVPSIAPKCFLPDHV